MKVAKITEPYKFELVNQPDPRAKDEWVVVKVLSAPMCSEHRSFKAGLKPSYLGHEAAGEVVEVDRSAKVKVGDRVAVPPSANLCGTCEYCRSGDVLFCQNNVDHIRKVINFDEDGNSEAINASGTWAQYMLKEDWMLTPIPREVSIDHGSMMCCGLGPSFGAMQRIELDEGETVLVIGAGAVGLGAVVNATHRRAHAIALEPHPYRRRLASDLGAMAVLDPTREGALEQIMDLTKGRGVDAAIDCSSNNPAGLQLALDALRRQGKLALLGGQYFNKDKDYIKLAVEPNFIFKGLTLCGAWMYNIYDAPKLMQVIRDCGPLLDKQITHRLPMSRTPDAFELQSRGECGKIVLHPWED
jgi:threonine dehydrogenase-like Zn-dependent dehydrogenase